MDSFFVTAWNNGSHNKSGAGYGLKISIEDREIFFNKKQKSIALQLSNGNIVDVNIGKKSFWNIQCRELINKDIGKWMIDKKIAPWKKGNPPKLKIIKEKNNQFKLSVK